MKYSIKLLLHGHHAMNLCGQELITEIMIGWVSRVGGGECSSIGAY